MVGVLAFRVICWLRWVKVMLGIEKSVVIGPRDIRSFFGKEVKRNCEGSILDSDINLGTNALTCDKSSISNHDGK